MISLTIGLKLTMKPVGIMTMKVFGFSSTNVQLLNTKILQSDKLLPEATDKERPAGCLAATANRPQARYPSYAIHWFHQMELCSISVSGQMEQGSISGQMEQGSISFSGMHGIGSISVSGVHGTGSISGAHDTGSISGAHDNGTISGLEHIACTVVQMVFWHCCEKRGIHSPPKGRVWVE